MFLRRIVPFLVLSFFVVVGCSQSEGKLDPPSPDVVAVFNGGMITKAHLQDKFDDLMPCCKGRYEGPEGRKVLIKEMALPQIISRVIKEKKIDLRGNIRKKLGDLTDELNTSFLHMKFHEQIISDKEEYTDLKEKYDFQKKRLEGLPLSERYTRLVEIHEKLHPEIAKEVEEMSKAYINKLRKEAAITKNYNVLRVQVTREELKDFYQRHQEGLHGHEYRVPEKIRVREIAINVAKDKEDCSKCEKEKKQQAREKAESALSELRSGARFETVAQTYAGDQEASIKPKWIIRKDKDTTFEEAVFSLDAGEMSPVLEKDDGFSIVKVFEKKPMRFKSFDEIVEPIAREYQWQKAEDYLKENRDRILFTINSKPYTIGDFADEYAKTTPKHQCHHMDKKEMKHEMKAENPELCDLSHNTFEEQKQFADRMIEKELITEDTYNQMIHVENKEEIEFLTMTSLYPIFHQEEMDKMIHVTDKMVEDYYQEHQETYQYPSKAKLSLIVLNGGEKETEKKAAYEKAMKAYKELNPSFFSFKKGKEYS